MKKIALLFCVLALFSGCTQQKMKEDFTRTTYALGTVITINLYDQDDQALMERMINRITEIENLMSAQMDSSEVSEITLQAGINPVPVSEETYTVVARALYYAELSEGRFDPTIGTVASLWGIGTEEARVPELSEIEEALRHVDYKKVVLDEENRTVYLAEEGMSLDLGGIAKGYVADELVAILKETEVERAMINLGGNIYAYGEKWDGSAYKIAIQTPYDSRNTYFGYVELKDMTVVTSGPYERYFEEDGNIYHHIFNAKTGYPIESDVVSTSIIAESSIDADALSTLLFTMAPEEGLALIEAIDNIDCIYVDKDYKLTLSSGIKDNFVVTDSHYRIEE